MDNCNGKKVRFSYSKKFGNDELEDKYGTIIGIEYSSKKTIDKENSSVLNKELKNFVSQLSSNSSIIDIVKNIRDITSDLEEGRLNVTIGRVDSGEYVYYKNGLVESCGAYREKFDDNIYVYCNTDGIDIKYKKDGVYLNSEKQIVKINKELYDLYNIVLVLNNMIKQNDKEKDKDKVLSLSKNKIV